MEKDLISINQIHNPFDFQLEDLFLIGKRENNNKRNFLFINKLLGKHIPVVPDICKATGQLLTSLYLNGLNQEELIDCIKNKRKSNILDQTVPTRRTLVLGFAETATGLGMAVASCMENAVYYSTTRESYADIDFLFSFEEEHSHATTHKCYDSLHTDFSSFDEIVLVDDEITTGNSMLNLIKELHRLSNVKQYRILSILDWRSKANKNKFKDLENRENISIDVHSIVSGEIKQKNHTVYHGDEAIVLNKDIKRENAGNFFARTYCFNTVTKKFNSTYKNCGRFGVTSENIRCIEDIAKRAADQINETLQNVERVLVISEGEDIYIPSRIASYIKKDVEFKTTTRSPIYCDGIIIRDKYQYRGNNGVTYYLYNKEQMEKYDAVLFIGEFKATTKLTDNMRCITV